MIVYHAIESSDHQNQQFICNDYFNFLYKMKNLLNYHRQIFIVLFTLLSGATFAHFGSKGPFGGSVSCMAVSPDSSVVYVGTFTGGVYESTNSTLTTWRARPVGLKQGHITALAHTGSYLFAATADSGVFIFNGREGSDRYWIQCNNGLSNLKTTSLLVIDSISLMVGTEGGGIFKTTNKGQTWTEVNNPILHHYEITGFVKAGNKIIHSSYDGGAWASDDFGASWYGFNDDQTLHIYGTTAIDYNKATNQIMLLNDDGLFVGNINQIPNIGYTLATAGLPANCKVKNISNNGNFWFLATDAGLFSSLSSNIYWTSIQANLPTLKTTAILAYKDRLICGTEKEGIFASNAQTISWEAKINGFNNLATYSMATIGSVIIAATEKGVFASRDLATTYIRANTGLSDSLNIRDLCFADFCTLAATKNAGVYFSADTGKSWIPVNNGLASLNIKKVYCDVNYKYAVSDDNKVYRSPMHSYDWTLISTGLNSAVRITNLYLLSDGKLLLSSNNEGVYLYTGSSWSSINTGLTNLHVTSVTAQGDSYFAGTWGNGVYVTNSTNISWQPVSASPENKHTNLVNNHHHKNYIQSMHEHEGFVYAGYRGGLFATFNQGATWTPAGNQFNLPTFTNVAKISMATGRVFVSTQNNGLYSNSLSELPAITSVLADKSTENTSRIYPNPSKEKVFIESRYPVENLSLYNLSGQFMANPKYSEGVITLDFPAGVYMLQVKTEKTVEIHKIILQ